MIARLSILLPFSLVVPEGDVLDVQEMGFGIYRVRVHPPCQALLNPGDTALRSRVSFYEILEQLKPAKTIASDDAVLVNGHKTFDANLVRIDVIKDTFDRTRHEYMEGPSEGDPPPTLGFEIANRFLQRLRTITRGSPISLLTPERAIWELEYLADDETPFPNDPKLIRRRTGYAERASLVILNKDIWDNVARLPFDFTSYVWDRILLDAKGALPDVAASISLANAALEVFSSWLLERIVSVRGLPAGLWTWINDRGDWYKEPSVDERFDPLLLILTGASLKTQPTLWQAYKQLRNARNNFAHRGRVVIGKQFDGPELSYFQAMSLVEAAGAIIDWCETLLPAHLRRPPQVTNVASEINRNVINPSPAAEPPPV